MRYYFVVRGIPERQDYGHRDVIRCSPNAIRFVLDVLGALAVGEGSTREEAIAASQD